MSVTISPPMFLQFQNPNNTGAPAAGLQLFTYIAGSSTKQSTWTDSTQTVVNPNPYPLDALGGANLWGDPTLAYKFVWAPVNDTDPPQSPIRSVDNLYFPLSFAALTQNVLGLILYPRTAAEIAASVTPVNFAYAPGDVRRYGADPTGAVASDTAFTSAEAVAYTGGAGRIYAPAGTYVLNGTLTLRSGVTLIGDGAGSEYYIGSPFNTAQATLIWKKTTGTAGPLFILLTASQIAGCYLRFDKVNGGTTGIVQMGAIGTANFCYRAGLKRVFIYGAATADISGTNTCYGIYFPPCTVAAGGQRYFNEFVDVTLTNCDIPIHLDSNSNGNRFTAITTRQCYYHYDLNGGADNNCVENTFTGLILQNIGTLPTTPTLCFRLQNGCANNVFSGYSTECNGSAFSIDAVSAGNVFLGHENEGGGLSVVPPANTHILWAQPNNRSQNATMLLPAVASPQNYTSGQGNLVRQVINVSGTLPQLNGTGTLVAADVNSKVFARFNSTLYTKAAQPCFRAKLTVAVDAPGGGVGEGIVEVEFWYRATDNSTHAASLSVISVSKKPAANYIAGLKFLTGVASGLGMGLAIVGGNVGAVTVTHLIVDLEILAFTFSTNTVAMANYAAITWGTAAATANDVTDAIDLLTVADTAV